MATINESGDKGLNAPWWSPEYARASNVSAKSGLDLERERRAKAGNISADPVRGILQSGVLPANNAPVMAPPGQPEQTMVTPGAPNSAAGQVTVPPAQTTQDGSGATNGATAGILAKPTKPTLPGRDASGVITAESASAWAKENPEANSYNGKALNETLANENKIRGELIDSMVKAQGGNGVSVLKDRNAEWNDQMRRQGEIQQITDAMARNPLLANAMSGALTQTVAGQKQQASDAMRQKGIMAGLDVQRRGQDIQAQTDAAKLAGNPLDNRLKEATISGALADNDSKTALAKAKSALATETDPVKRAALLDSVTALSGKGISDRFVRVEGGEELSADGMTKVKRPSGVFDSVTREFVPMQPGTGKQSAAAVPSAGEVRNGYRFKGGNPADKNAWEKV